MNAAVWESNMITSRYDFAVASLLLTKIVVIVVVLNVVSVVVRLGDLYKESKSAKLNQYIILRRCQEENKFLKLIWKVSIHANKIKMI